MQWETVLVKKKKFTLTRNYVESITVFYFMLGQHLQAFELLILKKENKQSLTP